MSSMLALPTPRPCAWADPSIVGFWIVMLMLMTKHATPVTVKPWLSRHRGGYFWTSVRTSKTERSQQIAKIAYFL